MAPGAASEGSVICDCKVGRLVESFDLPELNDELERMWTDEDVSVRTLARTANKRAVERTLEEANTDVLRAEIDTIYDQIQGTDVSEATMIEKRRQLERDGVDVETLSKHFVSHQTMYRHLTGCLELAYEKVEMDGKSALEQIRSLQHRTASVTEERVERLANNDVLDHDDYQVIVDVTATCDYCGTYYELDDFFSQGGCGCRTD